MPRPGLPAPVFTRNGEPYPKPNSVLAFYKVTCPTCKLTMPYLDRVKLPVIGVSQDDAAATAAFAREFEVNVPSVLDPADSGYEASNAYGIHHVPTLFVIDAAGNIAERIEGFDKRALESLGVTFTATELVPQYKPG
jgi:peroxiredoxin